MHKAHKRGGEGDIKYQYHAGGKKTTIAGVVDPSANAGWLARSRFVVEARVVRAFVRDRRRGHFAVATRRAASVPPAWAVRLARAR